jgi:hypothetical protein
MRLLFYDGIIADDNRPEAQIYFPLDTLSHVHREQQEEPAKHAEPTGRAEARLDSPLDE